MKLIQTEYYKNLPLDYVHTMPVRKTAVQFPVRFVVFTRYWIILLGAKIINQIRLLTIEFEWIWCQNVTKYKSFRVQS